MSNEETIKLEARLAAIEYHLSELFRMVYGSIGVSLEDVQKSHEKFRKYLQTMKMPTDDPAVSDMAAGEIQDAHERLLNMILTSMRGRTT